MSQLKKIALKSGVLVLVLWGGYNWVNQTPERAEATAVKTDAVVETTLDTADRVLDRTGEVVDEAAMVVSDNWGRLVTDRVDNLQDRAAPIGNIIKKNVNPNNIPGVKAAGWLDGKTSFPAMLLLLVAGVMLSMMALASPSSLTGGRH